MFLDLSEIRWYEDVVFKQEIKIQTENIRHKGKVENFMGYYFFIHYINDLITIL